MKTALITGITGQDGVYLTELLLDKGYIVHGIRRRSSMLNTQRIDHMVFNPDYKGRLFLHYGDLTDSSNIPVSYNRRSRTRSITWPHNRMYRSVLNTTVYGNGRCHGVLLILEAIRILKLEKKTRFYQASTSELYGKVQEIPKAETTPFLSPLPGWRGQTIRILDHGELPRSLMTYLP